MVILLDTYAFYFITIVSYSYSPAISVSIGVIYSIIFMVVVYYGYVATKFDPTDPIIYKYRDCKEKG